MSEHSRTSRRARLVDPSQPVQPSPFVVPTGQQVANTEPPPDARGSVGGRDLFQSSRADYSLRWTETGLRLPPPPESEGDWPSDRWRRHLAGCGPVRECRHRVPEPRWWVLMANRGVPLHRDAEVARQLAHEHINGFRGNPVLPEELITFVQDVVRDALNVAPQPVALTWVKTALSTVATLARWVVAEGGPLTREHVFSQRVRDRYVNVHLQGYTNGSVATYRSRLNLITTALNGVTVREPNRNPGFARNIPLIPLTRQQEVGLFVWACGLHGDKRRHRAVRGVTLGLGLGPTTSEMMRLVPADVTADERGVHVQLTGNDGNVRVVTCRREWEARLLELVEVTDPGRLLVSPWRSKPLEGRDFGSTLWQTQEQDTPPAYFNIKLLRNTWLVRQLESGVPLTTLLTASGLATVESVLKLLPFCAAQDPAAAAVSLRGRDA